MLDNDNEEETMDFSEKYYKQKKKTKLMKFRLVESLMLYLDIITQTTIYHLSF